MLLDLRELFVSDGAVKDAAYPLDMTGIDIGGEHPFTSPVDIKAHVENKAGIVTATIKADFTYKTACDRCMIPIEREFEGEIKRVARESGDRAVTHYEVVRQYADYALLKVQIETGRTHQIRVHMSYIGHPLLGDSLYGNGPIEGLDRAALHAGFMQFYQPFNGNSIRIGVKLPPDMDRFVRESPLDITPYTW
jgi:hypothetical protein